MAKSKKTFALRVSPELLAAIEKWAADEFRSTNGQIEYLLHQALRKAGRRPGPADPDPDDERASGRD